MSKEVLSINLKKIMEMHVMQRSLNVDTNGPQWLTGVTKDGRVIDWRRCMYMETAEAIDSLNWKHWKDINSKDDIANLKIEVVDVWHFLMSFVMETGHDEESEEVMRGLYHYSEVRPELTVSDALTKLIRAACVGSVDDLILSFYHVVSAIPDFNMDDVHRLYIGKNCLNRFRQDNGYADGTYIKMWGDVEDNVVMTDTCDSLGDDLNFDTLYGTLDVYYKTFVALMK